MEEDDDIGIDFGKIKGFFKGKKEKNANQEHKEDNSVKDEDDDLSFNFNKIKSLFKSKEKTPTSEESKEDETGIDIKKTYSFICKHKVIMLLIFIILLQLIPNGGFLPWGGIWMRMQAQNMPQTEQWAESAVYTTLRQQIAPQINQQFPHLPDANKNKLIEEEFNKIKKGKKNEIQAQIDQTAAFFLSKFQYETNGKTYTYMPDIDPYMFLLYARNYLDHGYTGDSKKGEFNWDDHMLAPIGHEVIPSIHPYTLAYIYKFMSIFNSSITLMQAAAYFPIILVLLSLIPAFFIGRKLAGNVGGFFTASMIILNTAAFSRTPWGHADTDAYNLLFPLFIVWFFFESIAAKDLKKKMFFIALTGLSLGLYSWAWAGWWYVFDFMLGALAIAFGYHVIIYFKRSKKDLAPLKNLILIGVLLFISTGIFVTLFVNFNSFKGATLAPLGFTTIKSAAHQNLWPNVYTTVAELNTASIKHVINTIGGKLLFVVGVLGILLSLIKDDKQSKRSIIYSILLTVWFIGTIYASLKGVRFALLLVPAFSVAFGVALGKSYSLVTKYFSREFKIHKILTGIVLIFLFSLLLLSPAASSYGSVTQQSPIINDAWWNILTKIKTESKENAIINSWWDFGHHFKFIADRAVTFDGASQNTPNAHWIGKVLLTGDEQTAIGLLRMVDCGCNRAFETLNEELEDTVKSVNIIYEIIVLDKTKANTVLSKYIDNPEEVLQYTHCEPPENYFITSADMIQKAGVWAHFGGWDFEKAYAWIELKNKNKQDAISIMMDKFEYSEEKAEEMYYDVQALSDEKEANGWISGWPGFSSQIANCEKDKNNLICENGVIVDLNNMNVKVKVQDGDAIPPSVIYINKNKEYTEKTFDKPNFLYSVVLIPSGDGYTNLIVTPELAKSMFTRLFFMQGHGLKYFKIFDTQRQVTGQDIYVWKIDWQGLESNIHSDLIEKKQVSKGDTVKINYIGWLDNETVFESNIKDWQSENITKDSDFSDYETNILDFKVGSKKVIQGLEDAAIDMKLNQIKTVRIEPEDAYGTDPEAHPIGNQTLNFKIQVISIK